MSNIDIDMAQFEVGHRDDTDSADPALWTFSIQEKDVCFWGRYPDAASTAKEYAQSHGVVVGTIKLVDCTGSLRCWTRH